MDVLVCHLKEDIIIGMNELWEGIVFKITGKLKEQNYTEIFLLLIDQKEASFIRKKKYLVENNPILQSI